MGNPTLFPHLASKSKVCTSKRHQSRDHPARPVDLVTDLFERSRRPCIRLKMLLLTGRAAAALYEKDKFILDAAALLASIHSSAFHRKGRRRIHTRAVGVPEPDR
jgi:hypothetical protein